MDFASIEVSDSPTAADLEIIGNGLAAFNEADAGPAERRALAVFVRDDEGTIVAGISGYTAWGWLYIQWLWVDESHRGKGLARCMLDAAETEAHERGCHGALIDTFNPNALSVYQKAGYVVFGALPDFPIGRTRSFLSKSLR